MRVNVIVRHPKAVCQYRFARPQRVYERVTSGLKSLDFTRLEE
jgi:hypothetical protein